jgi:hypothetical protein
MHVRIPHVSPVLADNFFLFHMRVYFELPLVANLSHVRNIFFESSCMYTKEGQPASMLSQDYEIRRIFLSICSLFSWIFNLLSNS